MGMPSEKRVEYESKSYHSKLSRDQQAMVKQSEEEYNLFNAVQEWLERLPFLDTSSFDFIESYKKCANQMFEQDRAAIERNLQFAKEEDKVKELSRLELTR
jgi:tryptophan 2,3-dioxygenase